MEARPGCLRGLLSIRSAAELDERRGHPTRSAAASFGKEILLDADPADVWAAISDVGAVHERLVPGVQVDARLDGNARVVTFANSLAVRELIVTLDHDARRFVYASVGGRATHHNASIQVFADGERRPRQVWITDVLPADWPAPSARA